MDPDEDVSLPAMSALISRFRDSLLFDFVSLYNQCTYPFFFCMVVVVVCYYIIVYLLLIRSTAKPVNSGLKQAKVSMVVARRNIKSTGIGIRETSGGSEMTGSNEWLIHK